LKVLLISALGYPVNDQTKYGGIEHTVWEYAKELSKKHKVTVCGHADSVYSEGVSVFLYKPEPSEDIFQQAELKHYGYYQQFLRDFDVIHDFSHSHLASRFNTNLPSLNPFYHAPALARYEKAPYNIIALSGWAAVEFQRVYRQTARYQQSICIDTSVYKLSNKHRNDRFFTLGIMSPNKGNLNAIKLCLEAKVPLDVAGSRGSPHSKVPLTDYELAVLDLCDGKQIRFLGEINHSEKIKLMQTCRALIYVMPPDYAEVASHKLQEARCRPCEQLRPRLPMHSGLNQVV